MSVVTHGPLVWYFVRLLKTNTILFRLNNKSTKLILKNKKEQNIKYVFNAGGHSKTKSMKSKKIDSNVCFP